MKKNPIKSFFCAIGRTIKNFFLFLTFSLAYIFVAPFIRCKVVGKKNVNKTDEARVFVANHYEIYGPIAIFLRFPYKFRPWVIDKMTDPAQVEQQMSLGIYGKFEKYPIWIKKIAIKLLKNIMVYTMNNRAKAIPVSRENPRANIKTMQESVKTLEKGKNIVIFPELSYVDEGVGEFQTGFEHLAKFYHQKTGKKITFYPIFVSQIGKKMFIEKPITFNPENDPNQEKKKITTYLHEAMVQSYLENEVNNAEIQKKKEKKAQKK